MTKLSSFLIPKNLLVSAVTSLELMCDVGNLISNILGKVFPLNDGEYDKYVRRVLELYPFYSQCILIPGMAFERWLLVCRPTQAATVLKSRYRFIFYVGISILALLIPSSIFLEYFWFQRFNHVELEVDRAAKNYYLYHELTIGNDTILLEAIYQVLTNEIIVYREVTF